MPEFNEFKKISSAEWKLKIQSDLKGEDYSTLITHTSEDIDIKPFYHFDDFKKFKMLSGNSFVIVQELMIANEKIANKIALKSFSKGAETFRFIARKKFDFKQLTQQLDFSKLFFQLNFSDEDFFKKLYHFTKGKAIILVDPIGHLIKTGNWYYNKNKDFEILKNIQGFVPTNFPFIEVETNHLLNAGATTTQQIAYALSQAVDYLENLKENHTPALFFNFGIGSQYFIEIAKFKAFRFLWELIAKEYTTENKYIIYSKPGIRNKSLLDPYVNMLRTTMESMAAILGGTDFISNLPYDIFFKKSNAFSERIARNQLIILKEEAGFDKALASAEGGYFTEHLTNELAHKSLGLFKNLEKGGGFTEQLYQGKIQEKIAKNAAEEQQKFDEQKLILVGVNKYFDEKAEPIRYEIYPFMKKRKGQTLIAPIIAGRLSENIEKEILKEKTN